VSLWLQFSRLQKRGLVGKRGDDDVGGGGQKGVVPLIPNKAKEIKKGEMIRVRDREKGIRFVQGEWETKRG